MQIVLSQLAEAFEGSLRLSGQLSGHNTEQIRFDPVGIQQRKRMSYFIPCALPSCVQPIEIMVLLCAVQREAYEERVGFKKEAHSSSRQMPLVWMLWNTEILRCMERSVSRKNRKKSNPARVGSPP